MISFKGAVFDYIYETETSAAGNSDIVISTNSNSDRITTVAEPLKNIEEVKDIVPSLNLYALYKDEYVSVRAFVSSQLQTLQKIDVAYGDLSGMESGANEDNIVVSKAAAEHFGLRVGDNVRLKLGTNEVIFTSERLPSKADISLTIHLIVSYASRAMRQNSCCRSAQTSSATRYICH